MKFYILLVYSLSFSLCVFGQNPYDVKPKSDETKAESPKTADEKFILENFPFIHMADWNAGMRFIVEYDEIGFSSSNLRLNKYKKSESDFSGILQKDYQGKIFTVTKLEEREVSCPRGRCIRTYVIFDCEGKQYEYEFIGGGISELKQAKAFTDIDKLIYINEIDKARELLINKKLYFLSDPLSGHNKFIPVTIINIGTGSSILNRPVKIIYSIESGKEYSTNIKLSGINSYGLQGDGNFYEKFSFENPRNKYPAILDEIWGFIQEGKVKIGMTVEECKLSWGTPKKINRTINNNSSSEQWVYSLNSYLYFEGGKLKSIQN
jgi:hypothetical protein